MPIKWIPISSKGLSAVFSVKEESVHILSAYFFTQNARFFNSKQTSISLTDFTKILQRKISLKSAKREPRFCLLVGGDKGRRDEANRRLP
jgi:hypothetical protein